MSKPKPRPIRLTKQRAQALLAAASRGLDEWEAEIQDNLAAAVDSGDLETVRELKMLDLNRAAAQDASEIVRRRFVNPPAKPEPGQLF